MIMGDNRPGVVENIRSHALRQDFYAKAELDDPCMSAEQKLSAIENFLKNRHTPRAFVQHKEAQSIIAATGWKVNTDTLVEGLEKIAGIQDGAVIVCNHFNQLDNTVVRHAMHQKDKKTIHTVIEDTNLALPGVLGMIMNHADTIPITDNFDYMRTDFIRLLQEARDAKEYILIYPEQEMWFNYRKPRPGKRGAYYYASRLNLPVISLFVEMRDKEAMDDENFHEVQYIVHVLDPLYPDPQKTDRANSIAMARVDDAQRKAAYEKAYHKPLTYDFSYEDIAGYVVPAVSSLEVSSVKIQANI